MTRSYVGTLGAIGVYAIGARFGLGWGFLAGVSLLAGFRVIEATNAAAQRLRGATPSPWPGGRAPDEPGARRDLRRSA